VQILEPDEDDRWRVRVGPIAGRQEAEELALRLKRQDRLPTWVLPEPGE
jgi:cell division septation protein DedD